MISRRTILAALPSATLCPGGAASANPTDPILAHYREWLDARAERKRLAYAPGNESLDSPELKAAEVREDAALDQMIGLTPTTTEGIAALLHAIWSFEVPELERNVPEYAEQVDDPVHKAILGIWRATTGTPMPLGT